MDKRRFLLNLILGLGLWLAGCRSQDVRTPEVQPPTEIPSATSEPTLAPVDTPVRPTLPPAPTSTPQPTALPAPYLDESLLGIELVGRDFGKWADEAADAGANWIRWNGILWSDVEPLPGERRWETQAVFEEQLRILNEQELRFIAIVRSAPPFAQAIPGTYCGPILRDALDAYGEFMFDLVSRYSVEPYNIKYWELGNEPDVDPRFVDPRNQFGCWGNAGDPYYGGSYYAEMLKAVAPRIKEADPEAQIMIGGLLLDCDPVNPPETFPGSGVIKDCAPSNFLKGILENGGGDHFDGVSFHAYDYFDSIHVAYGNPNWHNGIGLDGLKPVLVPKARFIKSVLAEYGYFDKLLFNTETSVLCGRIGNEPECTSGVFDRAKAAYVPVTYAAAIAEGLQVNVWFTLTDNWRRSQLNRPNGTPTEATIAFQTVRDQLAGVTYWGQVTEYTGVTGYKFRQGEAEVWVIWSLDGARHSVDPVSPPDIVLDFLGAARDAGSALEVSAEPLYLIWEP